MVKSEEKIIIDEHINIGRWNITIYVIVAVILLFISLYVGIKYNFYYHLIFIGIIIVIKIGERIDTYLI